MIIQVGEQLNTPSIEVAKKIHQSFDFEVSPFTNRKKKDILKTIATQSLGIYYHKEFPTIVQNLQTSMGIRNGTLFGVYKALENPEQNALGIRNFQSQLNGIKNMAMYDYRMGSVRAIKQLKQYGIIIDNPYPINSDPFWAYDNIAPAVILSRIDPSHLTVFCIPDGIFDHQQKRVPITSYELDIILDILEGTVNYNPASLCFISGVDFHKALKHS